MVLVRRQGCAVWYAVCYSVFSKDIYTSPGSDLPGSESLGRDAGWLVQPINSISSPGGGLLDSKSSKMGLRPELRLRPNSLLFGGEPIAWTQERF